MTSSKFSLKPPPFKVPAVCKKKRPGGGEPPAGDPLPADPCMGEFHIHGNYLGTPVHRDGDLAMAKKSEILWQSEWPAPPDGSFIYMNWNPDTLAWSGGLYLYGILPYPLVFGEYVHYYEINGNFDTEVFEWDIPLAFSGQKDGRYHNPL